MAASAQTKSAENAREVMEKVQPTYPELARRNGLAGIVKLKVVISPDGHARQIDVVGGNPVFVENATSSVKKWKWSVAEHETVQVVEIRFGSGL